MTIRKGSCLCGQVKYSFYADQIDAVSCYCRDCQRVTGSPLTTVVAVSADTLNIEGLTRTFSNRSAGNRKVTRHFCPNCGSQLFTEAEMVPGVKFVKCSTLDEPSAAVTTANFWLSSAARWAPIDKEIACFDENPDG